VGYARAATFNGKSGNSGLCYLNGLGYTIKFYKDDGTPLILQTTDGTNSVFAGTIPIAGSHTIATAGTDAALSQGWAFVSTSNKICGNAIFRQGVPGQPPYEASMPVIVYVEDNDYLLPFDNTTSATGVAIVNPLSYKGITVFVTFRDEQGNRILVDSFPLPALGHTSFSLADRFPQSAGQRGTVEFSTPDLTMNVLGLRFTNGGAFTSILPMTR
jgi:hypothetical protein